MSKNMLKQLIAPLPMQKYPAPTFRDKLLRTIWTIVNNTLYRAIPTPFFGLRRSLLRLFGGRIASNALPYPRAKIWAPWNLVIEQNGCIADGVICYNVARVTIRRDAIVSQSAYLCTPSHDYRLPDFPLTAAEIEIGASAWIATEAFVGPGVVIADRAIVGARSVVNKSVPENTVVVGNPAKIISDRDL